MKFNWQNKLSCKCQRIICSMAQWQSLSPPTPICQLPWHQKHNSSFADLDFRKAVLSLSGSWVTGKQIIFLVRFPLPEKSLILFSSPPKEVVIWYHTRWNFSHVWPSQVSVPFLLVRDRTIKQGQLYKSVNYGALEDTYKLQTGNSNKLSSMSNRPGRSWWVFSGMWKDIGWNNFSTNKRWF